MNFQRGLLTSAVIYTIANIINASIPLCLLPILTRVLSPADYGKVAMFATLLAIFSAFTGFNSLGALTVRYFQQDQFILSKYVSTCLAILFGSLVLVLGIVLLSINWFAHITQLPAQWVVIAVIIAGAQFIFQIPLTLWRASNQPFKYASLQIAQSAINAALSLWLVLGLGWAWEGSTSGQSFSLIIFAVFVLILLHLSGSARGAPRKDYALDALKFGVPLIPHVIGNMLMAMSDRVMITNLLGIEQTGIYMVGLQVGMGLGLLTSSFNKAFGPWLLGKLSDIDEMGKVRIVRYTYLYFLIVSILAILLGLLAPWLLDILVGEKFRQASGIVIYIAFGFAFGGMYLMVTNYIFYMSKTYLLAIITGLSGFLNIILNFFLIQLFGLKGAAIGFVITQFVFFIGTWFLSNRVYPMPWKAAILK